jgi:Phosphotransferase enzyme family
MTTLRSDPELGTAELLAILEQLLAERLGGSCRVSQVWRQPSAYRSSAPLEDVRVNLDDGRLFDIVFKNCGRPAHPLDKGGGKPAFLHDPRREIEMYRRILAPNGLAPSFLGGAIEPERLRYWLFLERIRGVELYQVGDLHAWQIAATWISIFHVRQREAAMQVAASINLIRYDRPYFRHWMNRALALASVNEGQRLKRLSWLGERYEPVVHRLAALPVALIHGDFFPSNVFVAGEGITSIWPVDWETAALGPGLIDLAALIAGSWPERDKAEIACAYRAASEIYRRWPEDAFFQALDYCRLHLAVQYLGWAASWHPPAEQAQDWLEEAIHAAERLRL